MFLYEVFPLFWYIYSSTVEFHLSAFIETASHPDMQKTRIIGFLFENRLQWQFEVKKKFLQTAVLGYTYFTY